MYPVKLTPNAIATAKEAYDWYQDQKEGLGELFLTALSHQLENIQATPKANAKIKRNYRQAKLSRFPYLVIYEIIKSEIIILSIFHTSRNPRNKFHTKGK